MDTTVSVTPETAMRTTGIPRDYQAELRAAVSGSLSAWHEEPTAEEQLAAIGTLRRQLVTLELRLEDATEQLKGSRQWDLVQGLKEERKLLQKKLDRAIDGTVQWAQPTMI